MKFVRFSSGSLGFRALVFIGTLFFTFKSFLKHKLVEIKSACRHYLTTGMGNRPFSWKTVC